MGRRRWRPPRSRRVAVHGMLLHENRMILSFTLTVRSVIAVRTVVFCSRDHCADDCWTGQLSGRASSANSVRPIIRAFGHKLIQLNLFCDGHELVFRRTRFARFKTGASAESSPAEGLLVMDAQWQNSQPDASWHSGRLPRAVRPSTKAPTGRGDLKDPPRPCTLGRRSARAPARGGAAEVLDSLEMEVWHWGVGQRRGRLNISSNIGGLMVPFLPQARPPSRPLRRARREAVRCDRPHPHAPLAHAVRRFAQCGDSPPIALRWTRTAHRLFLIQRHQQLCRGMACRETQPLILDVFCTGLEDGFHSRVASSHSPPEPTTQPPFY
jgi:hypothetical protein